ncbi:MAG: hypothetical protein LBM97_00035 [Candidatus Nomurabacteria bacterium]|nr:hypothetical protein [Candidatus Nomurabacteria bacterium]
MAAILLVTAASSNRDSSYAATNTAYTMSLADDISIYIDGQDCSELEDGEDCARYEFTTLADHTNGNVASIKSDVRVEVSAGTYGYKLSLDSRNTSVSPEDSGKMIGTNNPTNTLSPASGSIANPAAFTSSTCDSWGFATPRTTNNTVGGPIYNESPNMSNANVAFDEAYGATTDEVNLSDRNQSTLIHTSKYAAIPTTYTMIDDNDNDGADQSRPYYIAACVKDAVPDTYKAKIQWTAISNGSPAAPPVTGITAPTEDQFFAYGTTSTTLSVTTDRAAECKYNAGGPFDYATEGTLMTTTGATLHSQSITGLANGGSYEYSVICQSGNTTSVVDTVNFGVSASGTAPTVVIDTPTAAQVFAYGTNSVDLTATTDKTATCQYKNASFDYGSGTEMETTGSTSHSQAITVINGGNYTYYVVCQAENASSSVVDRSWSVSNTPPIAQNGDTMQTVTNATCPAANAGNSVWVADARDSHTYFIGKFADGLCWMMTNLAYGGDGNTDYDDTKTLTPTNGSTASNYTGLNVTTTVPGTGQAYSTGKPLTTTGSGGQYGYLYNWCAAMGGQTNACNSTSTGPFDDTSICPAGWRLPTGVATTGEFAVLNNKINSGLTNSDAGLKSAWLAVYSGNYSSGPGNQGSNGYYWSSTVLGAARARLLYFKQYRRESSEQLR